MKIGIRSNSLQMSGYGRWKENTYVKLKEHGYSCSDFNMMDTDSFLYQGTENAVKGLLAKERELADKAGIEIIQVHGPWCWPIKEVTAAGLSERMEKMKKSIYYTSLLGCKNWVVHPIMPYGISDLTTGNASDTWKVNLSFFRELLVTAKKYDVTICIENTPFEEFSLATPESVLRLVNEINDERLKICLDTGHVAYFEQLDLAEEVRRLGNDIKALHVHDSRIGQDLHLMPYYGRISWKEFVRALRDVKFDGCFSLETVPPGKLPDDIFETAGKLLVRIVKEILM